MTVAERRDEVVSFLALGMSSAVAAARASAEFRPDTGLTGLEVSDDLRLSVAPRPGG